MSYGFKMAGDVTESRASGMLKEVEEDLARSLRVGMLHQTITTFM